MSPEDLIDFDDLCDCLDEPAQIPWWKIILLIWLFS